MYAKSFFMFSLRVQAVDVSYVCPEGLDQTLSGAVLHRF